MFVRVMNYILARRLLGQDFALASSALLGSWEPAVYRKQCNHVRAVIVLTWQTICPSQALVEVRRQRYCFQNMFSVFFHFIYRFEVFLMQCVRCKLGRPMFKGLSVCNLCSQTTETIHPQCCHLLWTIIKTQYFTCVQYVLFTYLSNHHLLREKAWPLTIDKLNGITDPVGSFLSQTKQPKKETPNHMDLDLRFCYFSNPVYALTCVIDILLSRGGLQAYGAMVSPYNVVSTMLKDWECLYCTTQHKNSFLPIGWRSGHVDRSIP